MSLSVALESAAATIVRITTPEGTFDIELLESDAPNTVQNFLNYVDRGDYNNTFFHRSAPGFILQGGGYRFDDSSLTASHIQTQDAIAKEASVSNLRGTVALAHSQNDSSSGTSQWFINLADNTALDSQAGGFTVFGRVTGNGMNVVDAIAGLTRKNFGTPFTSTPTRNFTGTVMKANLVTITAVSSTPSDSASVGSPAETTGTQYPLTDSGNAAEDSPDFGPVNPATQSSEEDDTPADTGDDSSNDGGTDSSNNNTGSSGGGGGGFNNQEEEESWLGRAFLLTTSTSRNITELHIINTSDEALTLTGTLYNEAGEQLGSTDVTLATSLATRGRTVLSASDVETLFSTSPWTGPAMLEVTGKGSFELMSRLESPSGLISNTNCVRQNEVNNIEGFDSPDVTFVRLINIGNTTLTDIRGTLLDKDGSAIGKENVALANSLAPKQAIWLSRDTLSSLIDDTWNGIVRLRLNNPPDALRLINLNRVSSETFFNFSCVEDESSKRVYLMTNAASRNVSELHLINTSTVPASFTSTVYGGDGTRRGNTRASLSLNLPVGARLTLSAADLESVSNTSTWSGPAVIELDSNSDFDAMVRLTSPSGLVSNTNCARRDAVHNVELNTTSPTYIRFINRGDSAITNIKGRLYARSGAELGTEQTLISSLGAREAVWLTGTELSERFGTSWQDEASLYVTADDDSELRLINLNFVNRETFFNFSCFEAATQVP